MSQFRSECFMSAERAIELQAQSWALEADGKLDEAASACREALRLMEAAEGEASPDVANLLNDLAEIEQERQNFAEVLALCERAKAIEERAEECFTGDDHPAFGLAHSPLPASLGEFKATTRPRNWASSQDVEKMGWEQLQAKAQRPGKLQRMAIMEPIRNHTGNHGSYVCPSYFDRADRRSVRIRLDTAPLRLL